VDEGIGTHVRTGTAAIIRQIFIDEVPTHNLEDHVSKLIPPLKPK
jgi:hypothetical protein